MEACHVPYCHLGTDNEEGTNSGLESGFGTFNITPSKQIEAVPIRFTLAATNTNDVRILYDPLTGELVLPEGNWLMCASVRVLNKVLVTGQNNQNNVRTLATVSIKYGDRHRHANTHYLRFSANASAGTIPRLNAANTAAWIKQQGYSSIAGSVASDGKTKTAIVFAYETQGNSGTIEITHAHLHTFQQ